MSKRMPVLGRLVEFLERDPSDALQQILLVVGGHAIRGEDFQKDLIHIRQWARWAVYFHERYRDLGEFLHEAFKLMDATYPCANLVAAQTLSGLMDADPQMWTRVVGHCLIFGYAENISDRHTQKVLDWLAIYEGELSADSFAQCLARTIEAETGSRSFRRRSEIRSFWGLERELEALLLEKNPAAWRSHQRHMENFFKCKEADVYYYSRLQSWALWLTVKYPERAKLLEQFAA